MVDYTDRVIEGFGISRMDTDHGPQFHIRMDPEMGVRSAEAVIRDDLQEGVLVFPHRLADRGVDVDSLEAYIDELQAVLRLARLLEDGQEPELAHG